MVNYLVPWREHVRTSVAYVRVFITLRGVTSRPGDLLYALSAGVENGGTSALTVTFARIHWSRTT